MATLCSAAKFREETSKKAEWRPSRHAAMHNMDVALSHCKHYFAVQHRAAIVANPLTLFRSALFGRTERHKTAAYPRT